MCTCCEGSFYVKGQIRSAVQRKRKAEKTKSRVGNKPINVPTIVRKK